MIIQDQFLRTDGETLILYSGQPLCLVQTGYRQEQQQQAPQWPDPRPTLGVKSDHAKPVHIWENLLGHVGCIF